MGSLRRSVILVICGFVKLTHGQESAGQLRRFKCQELPPYIILHFKRFTKNIFVEEKNPTIVNFPLRGVDFRECKQPPRRGSIASDPPPRQDLDAPPSHPPTVYDLIANVTQESTAGTTHDKESTVWKVHLRAGAGGGDNEKWFLIQDLIVEEIRKEMIFLGETMLQVSLGFTLISYVCLTELLPKIWERRSEPWSSDVRQNGAKMDVDKQ